MSVKAVLRYVSYVMHRHPSAETTATARCLNPDLREFSEVAVVERMP